MRIGVPLRLVVAIGSFLFAFPLTGRINCKNIIREGGRVYNYLTESISGRVKKKREGRVRLKKTTREKSSGWISRGSGLRKIQGKFYSYHERYLSFVRITSPKKNYPLFTKSHSACDNDFFILDYIISLKFVT